MASRFGTSSLHQRDARSALFENYAGDRNRNASSSPAGGSRSGGGGYGYGYTGGSGSGAMNGSAGGGYRPATPNS
ncbi:MAG: hypothetical protein Q9169_007942, partial [Polycauliona sp. 2 TL-2023]